MTYEKISEYVKKLYKSFNTANPLELCQILGIKVIYLDLPPITRGFCLQQNGRCVIAINNTVDENELPFCLSHELGHAMLHAGINYMFICNETNFVAESFETEADCFALQLLLKNSHVDLTDKTAAQLAAAVKVPLKLVEKWSNKLR